MIEIIIKKTESGGRLDKYLCKYLDLAPKSFVYKMLRKKNIVLNDKKASGNEILKPEDSIKLYLADETVEKFSTSANNYRLSVNQSLKLESEHADTVDNFKFNIDKFKKIIIYEDDNILAVNKPSGTLSQNTRQGDISVNSMIQKYLAATCYDAGIFTPGISNRLDRNTSGIILAAKNPLASRLLNKAIKEKNIEKKYLCIVKGRLEDPKRIEGFLLKDHELNKVYVTGNIQKSDIIKDNADFWKIITEYKPISVTDKATLLEVNLITGKSHQIRAHLSSIGHPLAGDPKYGDRKFNEYFKSMYGIKSQMLHAYKIKFNEMTDIFEYLNGKMITAPCPGIFGKVIEDLVSR